MPLAEKFCPKLFLALGDSGVRPVPVESKDRNNDGVLNGDDLPVRL